MYMKYNPLNGIIKAIFMTELGIETNLFSDQPSNHLQEHWSSYQYQTQC